MTFASKVAYLAVNHEKYSASELARPVGTTKSAIIGFINRHRLMVTGKAPVKNLEAPKPWTNVELEAMEAMWRDGMAAKSIARKLGRTVSAVEAKREKLQLPIRRRGGNFTVTLSFTVSAEANDILQKALGREGTTRNHYLERLIRKDSKNVDIVPLHLHEL
jgi:hypothetical protein